MLFFVAPVMAAGNPSPDAKLVVCHWSQPQTWNVKEIAAQTLDQHLRRTHRHEGDSDGPRMEPLIDDDGEGREMAGTSAECQARNSI